MHILDVLADNINVDIVDGDLVHPNSLPSG
jgi:hypothetical protein